MAANQFERHGRARKKLKEIFANSEKVSVIHYSCESFYDLADGRSPRITSVAIRSLASGQTVSFSIHQAAEIGKIRLTADEMSKNYDLLERDMLDRFSDHLRLHMPSFFLHWNMRDQNYGFAAIEHRHRVIGGEPFSVPDDRKIDLSRLLIDIYGVSYIGHPRLENLLTLNKITSRDFMTGAQEAAAFEEGRYVDLHRSTLRKADAFCNIAQRAWDKSLKTNAKWKEIHGVSFKTMIYLAKKHWVYTTFVCVGPVAGVATSVYKMYKSYKGLP